MLDGNSLKDTLNSGAKKPGRDIIGYLAPVRVWSGRRESNPRHLLGRQGLYH